MRTARTGIVHANQRKLRIMFARLLVPSFATLCKAASFPGHSFHFESTGFTRVTFGSRGYRPLCLARREPRGPCRILRRSGHIALGSDGESEQVQIGLKYGRLGLRNSADLKVCSSRACTSTVESSKCSALPTARVHEDLGFRVNKAPASSRICKSRAGRVFGEERRRFIVFLRSYFFVAAA